jgi:hypothetical protein
MVVSSSFEKNKIKINCHGSKVGRELYLRL